MVAHVHFNGMHIVHMFMEVLAKVSYSECAVSS